MTQHEIKNIESLVSMVKETPLLLVDFFTSWCHPCKILELHLDKISQDLDEKGIKIVKVDVEKLNIDSLVDKLELKEPITSVPTMILFVNGREAGRIVGVRPTPSYHLELKQKIISMAATD